MELFTLFDPFPDGGRWVMNVFLPSTFTGIHFYFYEWRGCMHTAQCFFSSKVQPTITLGFLLLWFLPGSSLVFWFLPHPIHVVSKKPKVSGFGDFFPWFLKTKQHLVFFELFTSERRPNNKYYKYACMKEDERGDLEVWNWASKWIMPCLVIKLILKLNIF